MERTSDVSQDDTLEHRLATDAHAWRVQVDRVSAARAGRPTPWRVVVPALAAACVLLVLGGVALVNRPGAGNMDAASTPGPPPGAPFTGGPVVDPRRPGVDPSLAAMPAPALRPASGDAVLSMAWRLGTFDERAATLDVVAVTGDGSCVSPGGVQVDEDAASVQVWVWAKVDPKQDACRSMARMQRYTITLQAPLGKRQLVHAPLSESWAKVEPVP